MINIYKHLKRITLLLFLALQPHILCSTNLQHKKKQAKTQNKKKLLYIAGSCAVLVIGGASLYKITQPSTHKNDEQDPLQPNLPSDKQNKLEQDLNTLFIPPTHKHSLTESEESESQETQSEESENQSQTNADKEDRLALKYVKKELENKQLSDLTKLGEGGFGIVYDLEPYALKSAKKNGKQGLQSELKQIQKLGQGMVKAYGIIDHHGEHLLVLEKLFQKSEQEWHSMNDKALLTYALQALKTIQNWKQQGKKHKDIKHDNIGFRKNNHHENDEIAFIDPLPSIGFVIAGYGSRPDEINAMRSLLNLRFALKRSKLLSTALTTIKENIVNPICSTIQKQDIIKYLQSRTYGRQLLRNCVNEEAHKHALQSLLYAHFLDKAHYNFSNYIPNAYNCILDEETIPTTYTLKHTPQTKIVHAYLGLNMQITCFQNMNNLDEKKVIDIWQSIQDKAEKAGYMFLDDYKKIDNETLKIAYLKIMIAHIQACIALEKKHPSSEKDYFKLIGAFQKITYDNLIETHPNFKPMVEIIREETTIQKAIETISHTIETL